MAFTQALQRRPIRAEGDMRGGDHSVVTFCTATSALTPVSISREEIQSRLAVKK
jgi:hypothetical protein